jgi:hypothetical protein
MQALSHSRSEPFFVVVLNSATDAESDVWIASIGYHYHEQIWFASSFGKSSNKPVIARTFDCGVENENVCIKRRNETAHDLGCLRGPCHIGTNRTIPTAGWLPQGHTFS